MRGLWAARGVRQTSLSLLRRKTGTVSGTRCGSRPVGLAYGPSVGRWVGEARPQDKPPPRVCARGARGLWLAPAAPLGAAGEGQPNDAARPPRPAPRYRGASQTPQAARAPPEGARRAAAQAARAPSEGAHGPAGGLPAGAALPRRSAPVGGWRLGEGAARAAQPATTRALHSHTSAGASRPEAERWWWLAASPSLNSRSPPPPQDEPLGARPEPQPWSAANSAVQRSRAAISTTSHDHMARCGPSRRLQRPPRPIAAAPAHAGAGIDVELSAAPPAKRAKTWLGAAAGTTGAGSAQRGLSAKRAGPMGATRAAARRPPRAPKRAASRAGGGGKVASRPPAIATAPRRRWGSVGLMLVGVAIGGHLPSYRPPKIVVRAKYAQANICTYSHM